MSSNNILDASQSTDEGNTSFLDFDLFWPVFTEGENSNPIGEDVGQASTADRVWIDQSQVFTGSVPSSISGPNSTGGAVQQGDTPDTHNTTGKHTISELSLSSSVVKTQDSRKKKPRPPSTDTNDELQKHQKYRNNLKDGLLQLAHTLHPDTTETMTKFSTYSKDNLTKKEIVNQVHDKDSEIARLNAELERQREHFRHIQQCATAALGSLSPTNSAQTSSPPMSELSAGSMEVLNAPISPPYSPGRLETVTQLPTKRNFFFLRPKKG
ncbi:hypothetical protein BC937DRAFT_89803 [Endogone sp. FLAS-F59071]|nr:hypothetical protein BC937DRAFT_89803 [Endogone sp. FLAS-F59071]|eukprot:RUS22291.1 hypothetical protein BC937DRAFT_89803 [Endogone sp. FLAS-F59071]